MPPVRGSPNLCGNGKVVYLAAIREHLGLGLYMFAGSAFGMALVYVLAGVS
jgi:hypothetical protein